jgi:replicative DNA helicase
VTPPPANGRSAPEVHYSTGSRALADGVTLLLARFGIVAGIRAVTGRGDRPGYQVVVGDGPGLRTFCRRIGGHERPAEFARKPPTALAGHAADPDTRDDAFWDRIVGIEPLGQQEVFDATVKGTHNFVADGIVAHNSIEQDSDMVLLLHREDAYERESPRAGEADLILAKHRNGPTGTVTVAFQGHYSRFVDMAT